MKNFFPFLIFTVFSNFLIAQNIVSFESFELPLDTFLNQAGDTNQYISGDATFPNVFNPDFGGFWESGWAISSMRDDSTSGFGNLYGAITGSGFESTTYGVGQQNAIVHLTGDAQGKVVNGLYLTNGTFAHNSMRDGDDFAKKFGGEDGTDPDFFKLEIRKYEDGLLDTNAVAFYLADFRFEADSLDYIINDWQWVDLSNLGNVDSLHFTMVSSDIGDFGINTPLFFCIDNLIISDLSINIPMDDNISTMEEPGLKTNAFLNGSEGVSGYESGPAFYPTNYSPDFGGFWESGWAMSTMRDGTTSGFGNLYSAKPAAGVTSFTYAVGQQNAMIQLKEDAAGKIVKGLYVTNTTFAHNSMRDGDDFAKKFGGESGDDPDFFKLTIQKYSNGQLAPQAVAFYLADFRFEDNSQDYIIADWQWIDLTSLGNVDSLLFTLSSSDIGDFGINTPLFFSIDNLEVSEEISTSYDNIDLNTEAIKTYPNPVKQELFLDLSEVDLTGTLQVFDLLGRQVIQQELVGDFYPIDVSKLESGTYFINIRTEQGRRFATSFLKY